MAQRDATNAGDSLSLPLSLSLSACLAVSIGNHAAQRALSSLPPPARVHDVYVWRGSNDVMQVPREGEVVRRGRCVAASARTRV